MQTLLRRLQCIPTADTGSNELLEEEHDEYINTMPSGVKAKVYTPQHPNAPLPQCLAKSGRSEMSKHTMVIRVTQIRSRKFAGS